LSPSPEKEGQVEIRDGEGNVVDWGHIFTSLYLHTSLRKWEIWQHTIPQIAALMQAIGKKIEFQIKISAGGLFGGVSNEDGEVDEEGYRIATEKDIDLIASLLSG
jgi:hypothetical protein